MLMLVNKRTRRDGSLKQGGVFWVGGKSATLVFYRDYPIIPPLLALGSSASVALAR